MKISQWDCTLNQNNQYHVPNEKSNNINYPDISVMYLGHLAPTQKSIHLSPLFSVQCHQVDTLTWELASAEIKPIDKHLAMHHHMKYYVASTVFWWLLYFTLSIERICSYLTWFCQMKTINIGLYSA